MSSFYDEERHDVARLLRPLAFRRRDLSDAINILKQRFEKSPDSSTAISSFSTILTRRSHTYDMMIVKPIFTQGELIAWTATSTHTADTGVLLRGARTKFFTKAFAFPSQDRRERRVSRGRISDLDGMCRDPQYVALMSKR